MLSNERATHVNSWVYTECSAGQTLTKAIQGLVFKGVLQSEGRKSRLKNQDHHKQTLLFYNKLSLPKTAPEVSMHCEGGNMDSIAIQYEGREGGEKRQDTENQIYVPLLTAFRCVQKQKIYSNRSGRARLRQRDWVVHCFCSSREPWSRL